MAEIVASVAAKVAEDSVNPITRQLGYMWNYKTNFEYLEKEVTKLHGRRDMVQHAVDEATRNGEEIEQQVVSWLDGVQVKIDEAMEIIDDDKKANMRCFMSWCPNLKKRYQHSKKAVVKTKDVAELEKEGKFNRISYHTVPEETWHSSNKPFEDFESRKYILTNVINALSSPDVHMVGVHGMGSIGKTTLAREVGRKVEENKLFDAVVFVETPNIRNIQGVIADKLSLQFRQETEPGRASSLRERLKKGGKVLLILDNIWESLDLEKVGIPIGDDHKGCKLLLTARNESLLTNEMGCENNFPLGVLNERETWNLFKKTAGCVDGHDLQSLACDVAKECGGLPIAIVTIAQALKNKEECEWKNALQELQHPCFESLEGSVATKAYSCIRLSYDHLDTQELKSTFLLCCTMVFISDASIEKLLRYGIGLRLFYTINTMEAARDRVNTLIQRLKKSNLLLDSSAGEIFSMHDVVRDVGRSIAQEDMHMFIVKGDLVLQDIAEKNIFRNCTSITLYDIVKLPEELDCPQLYFLYVKPKSQVPKIPHNFFKGMSNLAVLHLIDIDLSPLPTSFCSLKKLRTLYLDWCLLGDIADIGDLKNLKILVLSSFIKQLPEEIGQLAWLKVLDLRGSNLEIIPPDMLSKLTQLEELYMPCVFGRWRVEGVNNERNYASLNELEHLSRLTALQIYIPNVNVVPKGLVFRNLQRYQIYIGVPKTMCYNRYKSPRLLHLKNHDASIRVTDKVVKQLKGIEDLELDGKQNVKNVLYDLDRDGFRQLKYFHVTDNPNLLYIVDSSEKSEPCDAFPHLKTLMLTFLINLKKICHGNLTSHSFWQLRSITVLGCVKLKNVFSSSIVRHLSQLEEIEVEDCENIEEIFTMDNRKNEEIILDKLHSLFLRKLPKLRSFCYEEEKGSISDQRRQMLDTSITLFDGKVKFPNLETLVLGAVNLKYLFSSSSLASFEQLQYIEIYDCTELEGILISIDDSENIVELPSLKKLRTVIITGCGKLNNISSSVIARHLSQLEEITEADHCENIEEAFTIGTENEEIVLNKLPKEVGSTSDQDRQNIDTGIQLFAKKVAFPRLILTMIDHHCGFQNLTELFIFSCRNLKFLFSSSTLTSFMHLQSLRIDKCERLEEVISIDVLESNVEQPSLQVVWIRNCPRIKAFIFNNKDYCSMNYNFNFSSLEALCVNRCHKMKMFSSVVANTPMLRKLELNLINYDCEGDVNTTMQEIYKNKIFEDFWVGDINTSTHNFSSTLQDFSFERNLKKLKSL